MFTILIVDDETTVREGLKLLLPWQKLGFVIAGDIENGKAALQFLRCNKVDIVITDIRMPVMSGLELIKSIHDEGLGCKAIILSGYADFDYARQAMKYGVEEYLLKPIDEKELSKAVIRIKHALRDDEMPGMQTLPDNVVERVKEYITENCSRNITIKEISLKLGYNPCYLGRIFYQGVGINIRDYLQRQRIEKACKLLLSSGKKNIEIAAESGFKESNRFYSTFKSVTGLTPRDYKRRKFE